MSKNKTTPGPWGWESTDEKGERKIALSGEKDDVLIATEIEEGSPFIMISDANAALIRAAPDLLASCKEQAKLVEGLRGLLTFYRIGKHPTEKVLDAVQDASEIQDRAGASIARAEGKVVSP